MAGGPWKLRGDPLPVVPLAPRAPPVLAGVGPAGSCSHLEAYLTGGIIGAILGALAFWALVPVLPFMR